MVSMFYNYSNLDFSEGCNLDQWSIFLSEFDLEAAEFHAYADLISSTQEKNN
jgi:hypothetical protein